MRQIPFFEIRSLPLFRSLQVTSGDVGAAVAEVAGARCAANIDKTPVKKASLRRFKLFMSYFPLLVAFLAITNASRSCLAWIFLVSDSIATFISA